MLMIKSSKLPRFMVPVEVTVTPGYMTVKYLGSYTYVDMSTGLECRLRRPNIVIRYG